ncbi:MAG: NosD domain-containing protein [Sphingopyxis sp.]|uniref:NosD domain-containing protein n=1 Tax=Sphingopyxis sp. TaxID=1908224 RepID=UPI002AB9795E|nr:NosD domain-containing protein [Sphingopyxis sp.]MDZ3833684.1 NosD domain-containing protein [Sphingopyxis sp.]
MRHLIVIVCLLPLLTSCSAEALQNVDMDRQIASARGGETIVLPAGMTGVLTIRRKTFSPAITIDAGAATLTGIVLDQANGVTVKGGTIIGPGGRSYGVSIRSSENIRIADMQITGAHRGVVVNESHGITLTGLNLVGLISDGINIALSRKILIERNRCRDFRPNIATFDASGKRIRDGDHPDCIQAWSRPTAPPVSDVSVIGNDMDGAMQGIFFGNHVRGGIDDGGFDRIVIKDNVVRVSYPHAIALIDVRGATITGNRISTVPGAVQPNQPHRPVVARMNLRGSDIKACDNSVQRVGREPQNPGTSRCR